MLRLAGPAEIILLSIWGVQLGSMGKSSFIDSLPRYGHDNSIGVFRKFPVTVPLTGERLLCDQFCLKRVIEEHGYPNKLSR
jgi:hypothetical protein